MAAGGKGAAEKNIFYFQKNRLLSAEPVKIFQDLSQKLFNSSYL
jgi:hypothetical protein